MELMIFIIGSFLFIHQCCRVFCGTETLVFPRGLKRIRIEFTVVRFEVECEVETYTLLYYRVTYSFTVD